MNLHKLIFAENACCKTGRKITVKGIMVHSTGANSLWLKRYGSVNSPPQSLLSLKSIRKALQIGTFL